MGFHPYTFAVFGAMRDKDLAGVVAPLVERVDHWFVCGLPAARAASPDDLRRAVADAQRAPARRGRSRRRRVREPRRRVARGDGSRRAR